jgi:hypothetical protein
MFPQTVLYVTLLAFILACGHCRCAIIHALQDKPSAAIVAFPKQPDRNQRPVVVVGPRMRLVREKTHLTGP